MIRLLSSIALDLLNMSKKTGETMSHRIETFSYQGEEQKQLVINPKDYIDLSFEDKKALMMDLIEEHQLYWDEEEGGGATLEDLLSDWSWLEANFVVKSSKV